MSDEEVSAEPAPEAEEEDAPDSAAPSPKPPALPPPVPPGTKMRGTVNWFNVAKGFGTCGALFEVVFFQSHLAIGDAFCTCDVP